MLNSQMTLGQLIEKAMKMETLAYEFYDRLETHFGKNEAFVQCLSGIKEDEVLHLRVLTEIRDSLSEIRLEAPVTSEAVHGIEKAIETMESLELSPSTDVDTVIDSMRIVEDVEFDVVMAFVDADEICFEFTRDYLKNESLDHARKVFLAQQSLY